MKPLPRELIQMVIDEVALSDDRALTLRACALTSRDFVAPSQRRLFHSVTLLCTDGINASKRYTLLQSALSSSPDLARYVRECTILDNSKSDAYFIANSTLPGLLGMLKGMNSFSLSFYDEYFYWPNFVPDLKQALVTIFFSPSISFVYLYSLGDVPAVLAKWLIYIPTLTLWAVTFESLEDDLVPEQLAATRGASKPQLKSLSFDPSLSSTQPLIDAVSNSDCELEELITTYSGKEGIPANIALINRFKDTLTTLHYANSIIEPDDVDKLDIGILPHLQTIKLYLDLPSGAKNYFNAAKQVLSKAKPENEILTVIFDIYSYDAAVLLSEQPNWESLDEFLAGPPLSHLHKVTCIFTASLFNESWKHVTEAQEENLWEVLLGLFPKMRERGLIKINRPLRRLSA